MTDCSECRQTRVAAEDSSFVALEMFEFLLEGGEKTETDTAEMMSGGSQRRFVMGVESGGIEEFFGTKPAGVGVFFEWRLFWIELILRFGSFIKTA